MVLAVKIAKYCESIDGEAVVKENKNLMNFEVYCIAEDTSMYTLKLKQVTFRKIPINLANFVSLLNDTVLSDSLFI